MQHQTLAVENLGEDTIAELSLQDLEHVNGAEIGVEWGTATGIAAAFAIGAAAVMSAPLIAGSLAGASIASSGMAMYYAFQD